MVPTMVIIGNTGTGKSTLCNTITSSNYFRESSSINSETKETTGYGGVYNNKKTFAIDTPGLQDGEKNDSTYLNKMIDYIKSKKETQGLLIALNYRQPRLDESIIKLFKIVANIFPDGSKWFYNLAIVWTNYDANKGTDQKSKEFLNWFKKKIVPDITQQELNRIPQIFIDSVEARNQNTQSFQELDKLISWVSGLQHFVDFLKIQAPDPVYKEKIEEKKIVQLSKEQKLNVITTQSADFRRFKQIPYFGDINYTDWEEIQGTRRENKEVLPVVPLGPKKKEQKETRTFSDILTKVTNTYSYKNNPFGRTHHVTEGYYYNLETTVKEEREYQPMNDGTIQYFPWKQINSSSREINHKNFYENHT